MRKLLFVLALMWVIAAFAYAFYERTAEAGLYSSLLGWQLEKFGKADINLTTFGTAVIYGLPGLITLSLTRPARGPQPPDPAAGPRNAALVFVAFGFILILVGIGAFLLHLSYASRQETTTSESQRAPKLAPVDLNTQSTISQPAGSDGVSVTGWLRRDVQYGLEEKGPIGKETVFCPFVGERWKISEPVMVVLRTDPEAPIALNRTGPVNAPGGFKLPKAFVPVDFGPATPIQVTIEGTVRPRALPDYVVSSLSKQGVKLTSDYVVLEAKPFFATVGRSEWEKFAMTSHWLTYIAVPLGLLICLFSLIPFFRWRRLKAQHSRI